MIFLDPSLVCIVIGFFLTLLLVSKSGFINVAEIVDPVSRILTSFKDPNLPLWLFTISSVTSVPDI